ncbi:MAG: flavin reductase family protein [Acidimicrobiales bacterium]
MAGGEELVGPFPPGVDPEQYDRARRRLLWSIPLGLYVLGSRSGERRNLMTLNWATQVATKPKLLAVSVEVEAYTHGLLREGRVFALNLIARDDRAIVRKFVKPLEDDGDPASLAGFALQPGVTGAPILAQATAWFDCEVRHDIPCGSHTVFVGEIVGCGGGEGLEVLRMEDTRMNYGG